MNKIIILECQENGKVIVNMSTNKIKQSKNVTFLELKVKRNSLHKKINSYKFEKQELVEMLMIFN